MPKAGHELAQLPQFPEGVRRRLNDAFSITTAEEFLGWASTQDRAAVAKALAVTPPELGLALEAARKAADPAFLQELEKTGESFATGAEVD